ncbi:MAG TPA: hypothetical protein PLO37_00855 [Candidatus Hydrogenedentes bacterium]|nr:hypothetical protein [Candidatus Hydrogenedentota bacterium]HPG65363.1 hypothetical protein [Candidatus Hydrogenedentota bacterium]
MFSFPNSCTYFIAMVGVCALCGMFPAAAAVEYTGPIGAVTSGGGPAGSGAYHQSDSAVGEVAYGFSSSGAYAHQAGVVQAWGDTEVPGVLSIAQFGKRAVAVTFSELMGVGVTDAISYTLAGTGRGTLADHPDMVEHVSDTTYLLTWNSGAMVGGGVVTVTVAVGVRDLAGNLMGPLNSASCPTVSDMPEFMVPFFVSVLAWWERS